MVDKPEDVTEEEAEEFLNEDSDYEDLEDEECPECGELLDDCTCNDDDDSEDEDEED